MKTILIIMLCVFIYSPTFMPSSNDVLNQKIETGAEQTHLYLPLLKNKRVAILANQTSIIGSSHLVDSLNKLGVNIVKVFGPEHGFRGDASAGAKISDAIDPSTGIPIISLYGKKIDQVKKIFKMSIF